MTQLFKENLHKVQGMPHILQVISKMICLIEWLTQLGIKLPQILKKQGFIQLWQMKLKTAVKRALSIVVQYVDVESADVHQHLLAFTEADTLNAERLCVYILQTLDTIKLDPAAIVSQRMMGHQS